MLPSNHLAPSRLRSLLCASALTLFGLSGSLSAQNQILTVSPDTAAQGDTVTVTFTLDDDTPAPPPSNVSPTSVTLGSISGSSLVHQSQTVVTAEFSIPDDATVGALDAEVVFTISGNTLTFTLDDAFTVTGTGTFTSSEAEDGYNLFAPIGDTDTYLMDNDGNLINTWSSSYRPGLSVYFLEDGSLIRTCNVSSEDFDSGGSGGRVEQYDWDGNLIWEYDYYSDEYCQHHDIEVMPNGNVLLISWELISESDAIAAGRDPDVLGEGELWSEKIVELEPSGDSDATIVWEWRAWDHLIQDYDSSQANYGTVGDHPELIDLNYVLNDKADWLHINSVDYNEELDQILLSVHNFSEIWIIDHSTTTAEAASHSGGDLGIGGDLLYRWGNPQTYDAGDDDDQILFVQHDAEWIPEGYPGANDVLIFNNGKGRPDGDYSSINQITTPINPDRSYSFNDVTGTYDPENSTWTYTADEPTDFYAASTSSAQRLSNGNTLICNGPAGYFFEVTEDGETVWAYDEGSSDFRVKRYSPTYAGFIGTGYYDAAVYQYLTYAVVDTDQVDCYDASDEISEPAPGESFAGQDAQYTGYGTSYTLSDDGLTVYDNITGMTWTQTPDLNGDGVINVDDKLTQSEALSYAETLNDENFGGYNDWRLPSIKELYSLMNFAGTEIKTDDLDASSAQPFIDTDYFDYGYGDTDAGERIIDSQFATTSISVAQILTGETGVFGLNMADGRIKGYPLVLDFYVYYVRGGEGYGQNSFTENGDGTVTDSATGLMWQQDDSGAGMIWEDALAYAEDLELGGYTDWRLPNAKELQSILDYSRSPDTTSSAAIDPVFNCTSILNEDYAVDYPWYWSSTTHMSESGSAHYAVYVCFGRAMGYMNNTWLDVHGAGAQRSDEKVFSLDNVVAQDNGYYSSIAPQGDAMRFYNYVRCVRGAAEAPATDSDDDGISDWVEYQYTGSTTGLAASNDDDSDGMTNEDEIRAGTDPTDSASVFEMLTIAFDGSSPTITWTSELDETYTVQYSTDLETFTDLQSNILATPPLNSYTPAEQSSSVVFYRIINE
ncbi:DUF1566 domain-containing protein [Cerasicoccus frondis]|uniref:Lcl domain-containing protein n=1 Tax=Cerasicoccus frondis TaxID=490090 RepID=UPI002852678D|nr:DUF1566 domain-containing protein [Cerasicoccus frondis]